MNWSITYLFRIAALFIFLLALCWVDPTHAQEKKKFTPDMFFKVPPPRFSNPLPNVLRWLDDTRYLERKKKEGDEKERIYIIDAKTGEELGEQKESVQFGDFKSYAPDDFDLQKPLLSDTAHLRFIYAKDNDLYLLDAVGKDFKRLTNDGFEEKNPTLSPDGGTLAFTRDHNLFLIDLPAGRERQITYDGSDVVYNGWAAWVYWEEIFGRETDYRAFWWSPDGNRLAFYRFDETDVPMFPIYDSRGQHGSLEKTRYPKAGDSNPEVRVGLVETATGKITWADFDPKADQYFGTPFWTADSKELFVQWMNRGQDTLIIFAVNPGTGKTKLVNLEHQSSWVDWNEDIHFLKKEKSFILKSDKDGWSHFYLHSLDGKFQKRITGGKWQATQLELVDEEKGDIYFTAKKEASTRIDLYRIKMNGKELKRLTFGEFNHKVQLSPNGSYFSTTYNNLSAPSKMALCDGSGRQLRELGDSRSKELDEYEVVKTELVYIPISDGYKLPALISLPLKMEEGRKYPVLITSYGGPNAGSVSETWRFSLTTQALAAEGLIQLTIDHRGSGHFGKEGTALMHRNLGKWEMCDFIEVAKWIRSKPFVDTTKICITGGSYGGYVVALALTYGADYFTHGIANYAVTDWKLYDTHYTERYMDTPAENPGGYSFGSVMTHAHKYKGLLRIVHGTMDDNVHLQNSIQLVDTLQNLGKRFEFMVYPGERHGWGPPKSTHWRMENLRFYYAHLLMKEFPESLFERKNRSKM